jgi:hypothetical protein
MLVTPTLPPTPIDLLLPDPWPKQTRFLLDDLPPLTWLVGPNGTGKSRFLRALRDCPPLQRVRAQLVSTDRLNSARGDEALAHYVRYPFGDGLPKSRLPEMANLNHRIGNLIGTVARLHERPDLRLRIEATLSQLLQRHIKLEMRDGNLIPEVRFGSTAMYPLFTSECHGVLELLVLLTNIYDDDSGVLLIDEPELNLHPQYQAFVLDELRRASSNKRIVLATHSPFFLDIKTVRDLHGVICFHPDFSPPSVYKGQPHLDREVQAVLPRMTEQHRSFFFASRPVFVEGYFDATVITSVQAAMGRSAEAAGSCVVPASGKDDAARYLILCNALGKKALFIFDLDALFDRRLSTGAGQNSDLVARIKRAGHIDYDRLLGQLQSALGDAAKNLQELKSETLPASIAELRTYLSAHSSQEGLNRRRVAMLVAIHHRETALREAGLGPQLDTIQGLFKAVREHLASVDIHILPGGALENHLPSYAGNLYEVPESQKRETANDEIGWLTASPRPPQDILTRYGALGEIIQSLPSKQRVDLGPALKRELAELLHYLITGIREGSIQAPSHAAVVLGEQWQRISNFVSLENLTVNSPHSFSGTLVVLDKFGIGEQVCRFNQLTQTNDPSSLTLEERKSAPTD